MHTFICKDPAVMHINDQGLTNIHICESYISYLLLISVVFGSSKSQASSYNRKYFRTYFVFMIFTYSYLVCFSCYSFIFICDWIY